MEDERVRHWGPERGLPCTESRMRLPNGNKKSPNIFLPHSSHKHKVTVYVTSQALGSSGASWRVQGTRREWDKTYQALLGIKALLGITHIWAGSTQVSRACTESNTGLQGNARSSALSSPGQGSSWAPWTRATLKGRSVWLALVQEGGTLHRKTWGAVELSEPGRIGIREGKGAK